MCSPNDFTDNLEPDLKLEDLPREALERLLKLYSRLYAAVDGFWYLSVKDRVSNDAALACDMAVWRQMCRYEMKHITSVFGIAGKDLKSLMTALHLTPWLRNTECRIELDHQAVRLTVLNCRVLEALEKEGQGREAQICRKVEPVVLHSYAAFFIPDIEVICIQAPPRQQRDGLCCVWELTDRRNKDGGQKESHRA